MTINGKYKGKYILSNLTRIGIKEKRNIYWNAKIGIKEEEKIYKIILFPNFAAFFKILTINIWWNQNIIEILLTISGKYEGKNIYSNLTRIGIK